MLVYYVLSANQVKHYSVHSSDIYRSMADSQAYCLRRANHTSDMIDVFDRMFKDEALTDCALICAEGHALKAHRLVLSACSPFFRTVFEQMSNHCPNYPMVYLKDMPISDLRAIIEFIYTGEVTVGQEQLESVIRSGEALRIKGLTDIDCRDTANMASISRRRKRRRHRRKSALDENQKNESEDQKEANNSSDDSFTEYSDDGSCHSRVGTPTDVSGSRNYNESVGASEDGIEPSKLLEQSMITGDTQESNGINRYSKTTDFNLMSNVNEEDVKPIQYEEPLDLMSQISTALSHECNSDAALNNTTHENQTTIVCTFDGSGIPSIPGTSDSSNAFRELLSSNEKRRSKSSKKSLHSRLTAQSMFQSRQQRFHCHICHQGFTAKRNLQRHMQIHNYYRNKFDCDLCQRQFSWKHTLNIHKEKAHNIKI